MRVNVISSIFAIGLLALSTFGAEPELVYQNDFEKAELDQVPEDLLVLDGGFAVKQENDNKFLELPGDPLDTYGVLFGPSEKDGIAASARVFGTAKGRRYPTFAVGLNGVGGYRAKVSPGKKALELFRGDTFKASVPYQWQPGTWTRLRLQVRKTSAGTVIEAKAWPDGKAEPADWMISTTETEELPAGRASVFGSPFSGTPIRYDDLAVTRLRQ